MEKSNNQFSNNIQKMKQTDGKYENYSNHLQGYRSYTNFQEQELFVRQTEQIKVYQDVFTFQIAIIKLLYSNINLMVSQIHKNKEMFQHKRNEEIKNRMSNFYFAAKPKSNPTQEMMSIQNCSDKFNSTTDNQKSKTSRKIKKQITSDSRYMPDSQQQKRKSTNVCRQTKHIPKNYSKAILNFILRNRQLVERVCQKQGKHYIQILQIVEKFKGNIFTVADLRSLWLQKTNPEARIFRILSMFYLRKHSLAHIFNSRIANHAPHIKYRYRIVEAVQKPESFNRVKQY